MNGFKTLQRSILVLLIRKSSLQRDRCGVSTVGIALGINPDEAVAYGATVQAAVLTGKDDVENKVCGTKGGRRKGAIVGFFFFTQNRRPGATSGTTTPVVWPLMTIHASSPANVDLASCARCSLIQARNLVVPLAKSL